MIQADEDQAEFVPYQHFQKKRILSPKYTIGRLSISHLCMSEAFRGFNVSSKGENSLLYILKNITQTCLLTFWGKEQKVRVMLQRNLAVAFLY